MNTHSSGMNQSLREIWPLLQNLDPHVQMIGGYGLYLKQTWLRDSLGLVVHFLPMSRWTGENIPRTTKDMDVGVSPSLIASPDKQEELQAALQSAGFEYVESKKQWGLSKQGKEGEIIELEFHAPLPAPEWKARLRTDNRRVKPRPSLHYGIHGRTNPELIGLEHPFFFESEGLRLAIPNVLSAAMMKLSAFKARWDSSQADPIEKSADRIEAQKHARDIFRIVAMETEKEMRELPNLLRQMERESLYRNCRSLVEEFFSAPGQTGFDFAANYWREDYGKAIALELGNWFGL